MNIDISADMGEGVPDEDQIWPLVDSANVACGGHIGDEESMTIAARTAKQIGVRLGAHPSYPDRENFGRATMVLTSDKLRESLVQQIGALAAVAKREELILRHVKPHGALYNDAHRDRLLAKTIVDAMTLVDQSLSLVAPDHSEMANAARDRGIDVIREAFADRRYEPDGSLVSRKKPGSLLTIAEAVLQAEILARDGLVIAADGSQIAIAFDTICIHSDMEGAVERLRAIRERLNAR
ncbi:MAG: 5-oxoprolinase subunit PxpA [Thermoanaerobaculia bacterium]